MVKVVLLGFGNVNFQLLKALSNSDQVAVVQIYNRSKINTIDFPYTINSTQNLSEIDDADVYIIGIADDAISQFSETLKIRNKLVVHTSGGVSMEILSKHNRRGVFYPLQTFSKSRDILFQEVPICIEAENYEDLEMLRKLASFISEKVVEISSEEREKIHLAAVFVNNFVNYLYSVSEDIMIKNNLDFNILKPLIIETAAKLEQLSPKAAQTGPAKRHDFKTIEKHLHLLENSEHKTIYKILTDAILKQVD